MCCFGIRPWSQKHWVNIKPRPPCILDRIWKYENWYLADMFFSFLFLDLSNMFSFCLFFWVIHFQDFFKRFFRRFQSTGWLKQWSVENHTTLTCLRCKAAGKRKRWDPVGGDFGGQRPDSVNVGSLPNIFQGVFHGEIFPFCRDLWNSWIFESVCRRIWCNMWIYIKSYVYILQEETYQQQLGQQWIELGSSVKVASTGQWGMVRFHTVFNWL